MDNKKIELKLPKTAIKEHLVLDNSTSISYSKYKELLDNASELDENDQFDTLLISPKSFLLRDYTDTSGNPIKVGIEFDNLIHERNDNPIYPHQTKACERFLKNFRGVGILADEVGMGKTIEAGLILSELAERKLISSVLIVAASEENMINWKKELGSKFGLFQYDSNEPDLYKALVVRTEVEIIKNCTNMRPNQPMLMNITDFMKLNEGRLKNVLFDLIIIDEAHNLDNSEEGRKGMSVLQTLMSVKKRHNKPYCILISGTPHKGNLDSMFPLWYFMKGDAFTTEEEALRHYKNYLCHGASTMAEFIDVFKRKEFNKDTNYLAFKEKYLSERFKNEPHAVESLRENDSSIIKEYNEYLSRENNSNDNQINPFDKVKEEARRAYYGLIDSFMIRQPRFICRAGSTKISHNYYFLPLYNTINKITIDLNNVAMIRRDIPSITLNSFDLSSNEVFIIEDMKVSIDYIIENYSSMRASSLTNKIKYALKMDIIRKILSSLDAYTSGTYVDNNSPSKFYRIDERYYQKMFSLYKSDVENNIILSLKTNSNDIVIEKIKKFIEIVSMPQNSQRQIITFFDYDNETILNEKNQLIEFVKHNNKEIYERLIIDTGEGEEALEFKDKTNAILLASKKLSESSNFQFCKVIINFSVSYSPILMDQKIGRIDRIGQIEKMDIYNFARMDKLDGYITSLFNSFGLFSGWKNDIILVTGCDNKKAKIKSCDHCNEIIRDINNTTFKCPSCGNKLNELKITEDYKCTNEACTFTFRREKKYNEDGTHDISQGISYLSPCEKYKMVSAINDYNEEVYSCPKECILEKCGKFAEKKCPIIKEMKYDPKMSLNKKAHICANCKESVCEICNITLTVYGRDIASNKKEVNKSCKECYNAPTCFYEFNKRKPKCAYCNSDLVEIVPSTFDEYAQFLWDQKSFVRNFSNEAFKISEIVTILGDIEDEVR